MSITEQHEQELMRPLLVDNFWYCRDKTGMRKFECGKCGEHWVETAGSREMENAFRFCPYCGIHLEWPGMDELIRKQSKHKGGKS
jgi:hypothetical protein